MVQNLTEHLLGRGLDLDLYDNYSLFGDSFLTLPLYDFGKRQRGFHRYNRYGDKKLENCPEGRYWYVKPKQVVSVFGLGSLEKFPGPYFLVGGLFKAASLHRLGYPALHVSGNNPDQLWHQLDLMNRSYFALGDNDAEGAQFAKYWGGWQTPVDVDEMSAVDVHLFIKEKMQW